MTVKKLFCGIWAKLKSVTYSEWLVISSALLLFVFLFFISVCQAETAGSFSTAKNGLRMFMRGGTILSCW